MNNRKRIFVDYSLRVICKFNLYRFIPAKILIRLRYFYNFGTNLNLRHPRTFCEKLQWLKLHDHRPEYTRMVDKYEAKQFITERIGEGFVIPTLGVWDKFEDIDFSLLPDQFVLKCNHDSGSVVLCRDKKTFDIEAARQKLESRLNCNYYYYYREWPYKNVKPRIIAEQYMVDDDPNSVLTDYKFFCFNGAPRIAYVSKDKAADPHTDFVDMDYNRLPIRMKDPASDALPPKPVMFEKMKEFAAVLSAGIPHLRVDFYQIGGKLYVGELTFYHNSGLGPVNPPEWNIKLGDMIDLSSIKR